MAYVNLSRFALFPLLVLLLPCLCTAQSDLPGLNQSGGSMQGQRGSSSPGSSSGTSSTNRRGRTQLTIISGHVVMEDGGEIPKNVIINRVCGQRKIREAYLDVSGNFSFQLGGSANVLPDAADDGLASVNASIAGMDRSLPRFQDSETQNSIDLFGCELQAQAAGYKSNSIMLASYGKTGQINVGTIVLQPFEKVRGNTISSVSLKAPDKARKALGKAEEAERRNRPDEAESFLRTALRIYPEYATAWYDLGQLKMRKLLLEDAQSAFEKAVASDPTYVLPHVELGRIALIKKEWSRAAEISDMVISLDSIGFPEVYIMNGLANLNLERLEISEKNLRKALWLDAQHRFPHGHLVLASLLEKKADLTGSIEQLHQYIQFAPQSGNSDFVKQRLRALEQNMAGVARKEPAS
jgi:tetratricopeptide (TPR) repeat protein